MKEDWTTAPVPPRMAAGLGLVHKLTREPADVDAAFLEGLRAQGVSDDELEAAAVVAFRFAIVNRAADAFAFPIPTPSQETRIARALAFASKVVMVGPPSPRFVVGADGLRRPTDLEAARRQLLDAPGVTEPSLRRDIEAYCAAYFGAERPEVDLPEVVGGYAVRLAAFPSTLDDEAIAALRDAGFDDEGIFELTMAGSMGVACAGAEAFAAAMG